MKKFLALLLALTMVLSLAACGSTPAETEAPAAEATEAPAAAETTAAPVESRPNRLIYGSTTEISGDLGNAWWTNNASDMMVRELINDYATVTFDQFGTLIANPTVTKNIESVANEDGTATYTITINEGLVYNNGEPISAKDFVAYLLVAYSPATLEAGATMAAVSIVGAEAYQAGETKELAGVKLIDDYTFSVQITADYATYYYAMNYASVSPLYLPMYTSAELTVKDDGNGAYLDGGELKAEEVNASRFIYEGRVSAGPYQIVSLDTGALTATLEINPNYAGNFEGQKPSIQTLVIVKSETETQFDAFKTGEINLLDTLSDGTEINTALDLVETGNYNYITFDRPGYGKIQFQCDFGPTQFVEVRQAVAYLLNRPEFAQTFTGGFGSVVNGPYGTAMWMTRDSEEVFNEKLNAYDYNPDKAVELLVAGGWTLNAEGGEYTDGIRYKEVTAEEAGDYALNVKLADGRILMPLHIMWSSSEANPVSDLLVTMLANGEQTSAAGMKIEQTVMSFTDLLNYMYRDSSVNEKYGVPTYGMYNLATNFTPIYDMSFNWSSDPTYVAMGYNTNYLFDDTIDQLSMDMVYKVAPGDDAGYLDLWQQYIIRWNELLPEIPLYSNQYYTVFPTWLENYVQSSYWDFQQAVVYASIAGAE